eukprot:3679701-Pyramimonas_sp.AAC.1
MGCHQYQSLLSSYRVNSLGGRIFFVVFFKTAIDEVRCEPARRWLRERLSVLPAKSAAWADKFNVKRIIRGLCRSHFQQVAPEVRGRYAMSPTLAAHSGPWKLPAWPSLHRLRRT